jgi:SAM-dependent methyltransferase
MDSPATADRDLIPRPGDPLPSGEDKTRSVRAMFDVIADRYDTVNRVMTFRMDVGWRKRTVATLGLVPGSVVVDLACGTGDLARELAGRGLTAIGADLSYGMLAAAPVPASVETAPSGVTTRTRWPPLSLTTKDPLPLTATPARTRSDAVPSGSVS